MLPFLVLIVVTLSGVLFSSARNLLSPFPILASGFLSDRHPFPPGDRARNAFPVKARNVACRASQADAVFAGPTGSQPAWLCREVLLERAWVLERAYGLSRADIAAPADDLIASREIVIKTADRVGLAVERYRQGGAGFSAPLIALAARDAGCRATLGLDRQAVGKAGMAMLPSPA